MKTLQYIRVSSLNPFVTDPLPSFIKSVGVRKVGLNILTSKK